MGVQVIPIPTQVVSRYLPFPFQILCFIPIPMGFPWDSRSRWESHSQAHLYCQPSQSNSLFTFTLGRISECALVDNS